jgi:hypothetical protein
MSLRTYKVATLLVIELDSGEEVALTVEADITVDPMAYADRDGRRGYREYYRGNTVASPIDYNHKLPLDQKQEFEIKLSKAIDTYDWIDALLKQYDF